MAFEVIMQGDAVTVASMVVGGVPTEGARYVWKASTVTVDGTGEYTITWVLEAE